MLNPLDPSVQFVVNLIQIGFYGGLIVLMVGLPIFIWMWVRFLRDVHSLSESLHWIAHCTKPQDAAAPQPGPTKVNLSAFGR